MRPETGGHPEYGRAGVVVPQSPDKRHAQAHPIFHGPGAPSVLSDATSSPNIVVCLPVTMNLGQPTASKSGHCP